MVLSWRNYLGCNCLVEKQLITLWGQTFEQDLSVAIDNMAKLNYRIIDWLKLV